MTEKTQKPTGLTKQEVINRYAAHTAEGALLRRAIEEHGISRKDLQALIVAKRRADKANAALQALQGGATESTDGQDAGNGEGGGE